MCIVRRREQSVSSPSHFETEQHGVLKLQDKEKNRCVQKLIVLLITELQKIAKSTSWSFKFCVENMFCYDIEII